MMRDSGSKDANNKTIWICPSFNDKINDTNVYKDPHSNNITIPNKSDIYDIGWVINAIKYFHEMPFT